MPNVSELARLDEEQLHRELTLNKAIYANLRNPKACREAALREVRSIERRLGLTDDDTVPEHNHRPPVRSTLSLAEIQQAKAHLRSGPLSYMDVGAIIFALRAGDDFAKGLAEILIAKHD